MNNVFFTLKFMENKISLIRYLLSVQFNILDDEFKYPRSELLQGNKILRWLNSREWLGQKTNAGSDHVFIGFPH